MVTLLNPPTPRDPPVTPSDVLVSEHERRVEAEIQQLMADIRRIGPTYPAGSPHVLFGELFDDEDVQQYYEALVGTLKCAKKRGVITFKGQMLLKGMSDNVKISIVEGLDADEEAKTQTVETDEGKESQTEQPKEKDEGTSSEPKPAPAEKPKQKPIKADEYEASLKRQSPQRFFKFDSFRGTPTSSPVITRRKAGDSVESANNNAVDYSSPLRTRSPFTIRQSTSNNVSPFRPSPQRSSPYRSSPQRTSPILSRRKQDIAGTSSDGEAEVFTRQYQPPPPIGACSDSEADVRIHTPRRGRVILPTVFLAHQNCMPSMEGRPPAPWRMRKAKSSMNVTKSPDVSSRRKSIGADVLSTKPLATRKKELTTREKNAESNVDIPTKPVAPKLTVNTTTLGDTNETAVTEAPDSPPNTKENDGPPRTRKAGLLNGNNVAQAAPVRATPVKQKSFLLSREASMRVDTEVHQLVDDIHRVGSNPGEPSVTFGELFDDETVQDTYEALIGTLRSAKRQGYIDFKGQMLFKGMHDDVTINVVEQKSS